jgi:hypothetical protein
MPKLKRTMPIKPAPKDTPPTGKWGSTYRPSTGGWEPDKPAPTKR